MPNLKTITLFTVLLLLLAACDTVDPLDSGELSELDRDEAYRLALWHTGELEPSESDIRQAAQIMRQIRMRYGNRSERLSNIFNTPWHMGSITISVTQEAVDLFDESGIYPWDGNEEIVQPDQVQSFQFSEYRRGLSFDRDLHPGALCEMYSVLPQITNCEVNYFIFSGFGIHPVIVEPHDNGGLSFYFTDTTWNAPGPLVERKPNGSITYRELEEGEGAGVALMAFLEWKVPPRHNYGPQGEWLE